MSLAPADGVFISYRRSDAQHAAGRLADDLAQCLGEARVFRDLHDIAPGQDFSQALGQAMQGCHTMLVLIGGQWLAPREPGGAPRLHEPGDWVRHEVETALARGLRVIPVLLELTPLPSASQLPPSMAGLLRLQASRLMDSRWDRDVADLVRLLGSVSADPLTRPAATAAVPVPQRPALPLRLLQHLLRWAKRLLLGLGALVLATIVLVVTCTGDPVPLAGDWHSSNGWQLSFQSLGPSKVSTQAQYRVTGRFNSTGGAINLDCQADQVIASVKLTCQAVAADGRAQALRCDKLRFSDTPATLKGDCLWSADDKLSRLLLLRR